MGAHVSSSLFLIFVLLIFLVLFLFFFLLLGFVVLTADMEKLLHLQHITRTWDGGRGKLLQWDFADLKIKISRHCTTGRSVNGWPTQKWIKSEIEELRSLKQLLNGWKTVLWGWPAYAQISTSVFAKLRKGSGTTCRAARVVSIASPLPMDSEEHNQSSYGSCIIGEGKKSSWPK